MKGLADADDTAAETAAEIEALEEARYRAMREGDVTTLTRLLSDDLTYSHTNGSRDSKEVYLSKVGKALTYLEIAHPVDTILVSGDHVLVHGSMVAHIRKNGAEGRLDNACLSIWRHETDGWRFLAFQPTPRLS